MKGADQVFSYRRVDSGLSSNRGIQHGQQRGRNLEMRNAPHVGGGDEAGKITGHSAAKADDSGVPAVSTFQHGVGQASPPLPRFGFLAGRERQRFAGPFQPAQLSSVGESQD